MSAANPHIKNISRAPYELGYLLKNMPAGFSRYEPMTPESRLVADAVQNHADNASNTLLHGIEAIGQMLMTAALNEGGEISSMHLVHLGGLIEHLAVEAQFMQEIYEDARAALAADDVRTNEKTSPTSGKKGGAA